MLSNSCVHNQTFGIDTKKLGKGLTLFVIDRDTKFLRQNFVKAKLLERTGKDFSYAGWQDIFESGKQWYFINAVSFNAQILDAFCSLPAQMCIDAEGRSCKALQEAE